MNAKEPSLRRLNTDKNRTDVENLFLKEMMLQDMEEAIYESDDIAIDTIIPDEVGEDTGLFDTSSEDLDDFLYDDEDDDAFSMVEL